MTKWVDFKTIKTSVGIEDILNHYGLLDKMKRKNNTNALVGPCPIHKGTNQHQFHVSLAKNNFNCFGDCHGGGNVLDFVSKMEKVDIRQAAILLQEWFGLSADEPSKDTDNKDPSELTKEKTDSPEETKKNEPLKFSLKLDNNHSYLKDRGLEDETIQYFEIGYCSKGMMKNRIAIPVHDENGQLIAYIGRWVGDNSPPEGEGKYKIPPNFHKSLVVYNLHRAKEAIQGTSIIIIVEGFFSCMKLWQAGFKNVVALMGSSMSEDQEKQILAVIGSRGKIILLLDEDEAGINGRKDIMERLSPKAYILNQTETTGLGLIAYNPNLSTIKRAWKVMNEHVRNP